MVYWDLFGSHPLTVLFKYVAQAADTLRILLRERPTAVFVMSPPIFAVVVVASYCEVRRIPFVIDAHSSAFLDRRWRHFQGLQNSLCRRAATTIVHNATLEQRVRSVGARATLVPDVPIEFGEGCFALPSTFTAAAACSFNHDEPIAELLAAARLVPDMRLFIAGDGKHMPPELRASLPSNVMLTGFLSTGDYGALLKGVDVVIALTTRPATMLRSAYEAVYAGTPVIVSDSTVLRAAFPVGAIHVTNERGAIAAGLERLRDQRGEYRAQARSLRLVMRERWGATRTAIVSALGRDGEPRS
jgi:glycosyltransferase involved in cell wall biosynthesis